jgi:hypothetical protein
VKSAMVLPSAASAPMWRAPLVSKVTSFIALSR